MCWPCFSPLAHEGMPCKSSHSPGHGVEKSHKRSKIEAEDFKFLRTDFDHLIYSLMLFSRAVIPF